MFMKKTNIAGLRNSLSRFIEYAKKGDEVLILDRQRPVAKLVGISSSYEGMSDQEYLSKLEQEGVIRRGPGKLSSNFLTRKLPTSTQSVLKTLLDERESGR